LSHALGQSCAEFDTPYHFDASYQGTPSGAPQALSDALGRACAEFDTPYHFDASYQGTPSGVPQASAKKTRL
jgi:hypothetical protein